ncbi:zinc finger BED domain-containing protein 4-like [Pecten maximus]|uniref:zinc finger BED domain-containing protein 4-like n=1 Tax=Pecten maximus TaxID=6579 RepID=UPI001458E97A|nr:zinc finger BED domain-containing protein 4-like [Pecten maximus]XP_033747167.1 zinc finger BED domain-containing protein 4-like [Pecten maximus]
MEGSHTSEKIAASLDETKREWCLPKIVATTDNAANEKKAFEILKWPRFGCYGHRINLIVKKSLEQTDITRLCGKGRRLVTLLHTSSSVNDKLREKQELLLNPERVGHKLIGDVPTRWNSTLAMLQRLIEQTPALMALASDEQINKSALATIRNCVYTFDETALAEKVVSILEPFKKATEVVCAEKTPTINKVLPVVVKLYRTLNENEGDLPAIRTMKATIRKQMEFRTEAEEIALVICILSPFTKGFEFLPDKKEVAEGLLRKLASNVEVSVTVKQEPIEQELEPVTKVVPDLPTLGIYDDDHEMTDESNPTTTSQSQKSVPEDKTTEQTQETESLKKKLKSKDTEDWLDDVICTGEEKKETADAVQAEISRYLGTTVVDSDRQKTVLEWWKANAMFSPRLSVLARRCLCVQASSVPSEHVFSLAGQLVSKQTQSYESKSG